MASFDELPLKTRLLLRAYPWRRLSLVPWSPLRRSLGEARVAIVTSAGYYRPDVDEPFRLIAGGDVSLRVLPTNVPLRKLEVGQASHSFDRAALIADAGSALPIAHLETLAAEGGIGSVAPRHLSFNGSILAPGRLVKETGPHAANLLAENGVDAALFVPV